MTSFLIYLYTAVLIIDRHYDGLTNAVLTWEQPCWILANEHVSVVLVMMLSSGSGGCAGHCSEEESWHWQHNYVKAEIEGGLTRARNEQCFQVTGNLLFLNGRILIFILVLYILRFSFVFKHRGETITVTLCTLVQFQNLGHILRCPQGSPGRRCFEGERSENLKPSDPVGFHQGLLDIARPKNAPDCGKKCNVRNKSKALRLLMCLFEHSHHLWPCVGPRRSVFPARCHRKQLGRADNSWTLSSLWRQTHTAHECLRKGQEKHTIMSSHSSRGRKKWESVWSVSVCASHLQVYTQLERSHLVDATC